MELIIRPVSKRDFPDLAEISRNTWDGEDYLETVSPAWLEDGLFMVGELSGKVIACGKITVMPGSIAWLEGLRVHPDFKGKGYGKAISRRILDIAVMKKASGEFTGIEFSTYINNVESRGMAQKQGFRITEWFHVVGREPPFPSCDLEITESELRTGDLSIYSDHAPCGWKYVHAGAADTPEWYRKNAKVWQVSTGARFLTSNRDQEISPLTSALEDPEGFVNGAMNLMAEKGRDYCEMMIHDSHKVLLETALKSGFEYWEEDGVANIPVYRFNEIE